MNGLKAFREGFMYADLTAPAMFEDFDSRRVRYDILWAHYENSSYRDIHSWVTAYKSTYGLYRFVRSIYSPAYRLGEFWKSHLWGGALDPDAGDGKETPSALPIVTDNDALRPAVAQLFRWSNWHVKKNVFTLKGAMLGDAILKVVDDPDHEQVYLRSIHPGTLKSIEMDAVGNVKEYLIEETRAHPERAKTNATYAERASRSGDLVVYETFLDGKPYAWPENESDGAPVASWSEEYGFIPMVVLQHNDVGLEFGWSELHPAQAKLRECDDLASAISDQIRKMIQAPQMLAGVSKPVVAKTTTQTQSTINSPQAGREDMPFLYAPLGATSSPLYADLDIEQISTHLVNLIKSLEADYPELRIDPRNISGEISARALRLLRQDAEDKVNEKRAVYDDAFVRACQMGISIGGFRGYPGFDSFGLESYRQGNLDFRIGKRPAFTKDPLEDLEDEQVFWSVAAQAKNAGQSMPLFLREHGWDEKRVSEFENSPEYKARLELMKMQTENVPNPLDRKGPPGQPPKQDKE